MEKKNSVSSHFKTSCSISDVSPVKMFDMPDDSAIRKGRKSRVKNSDFHALKINDLHFTVNQQQVEIKKLKDLILFKDEEFQKVNLKFESATKLLFDVTNGETDQNEVKNFLAENSKKRKVDTDIEEQISKKRKGAFNEDKKLVSFNIEESDTKVKRRKRTCENQNQEEVVDFLLRKPSKYEYDKEMKLNKMDEKIKADRENFKALEEQWKKEKEREQQLIEEKGIEKQKATALKANIRTNLSDEDLTRMTKENFDFLHKIYNGEVDSSKHSLFFDKCGRKSQSLLYTSINEPFSERQVDLVFDLVKEEFKSVPNIEENYISWVLHSEALLKTFMDFLQIEDKSEAEGLIDICPLDEEESCVVGSSSPI